MGGSRSWHFGEQKIFLPLLEIKPRFVERPANNLVTILSTLTRLWIRTQHIITCGWGSVVGTATGYGLDGPGIETRWRGDFPQLSRTALRPTQPPVFPGSKERPRRDADPSPLLVPWSRKSRALPLLPLLAVRPVQSLSACAKVHFTFYFYIITYSTTASSEVLTNYLLTYVYGMVCLHKLWTEGKS